MSQPSEYPTVEEFSLFKGMGKIHTEIYAVLLDNLNKPLTIDTIMMLLNNTSPNLTRRIREIRTYVTVSCEKNYYQLIGIEVEADFQPKISLKVRAKVLSPAFCFQCGRSPKKHRIVLVVDHIKPLSKGGTNEEDNLQPLCEDCNTGKKNFIY